MNIAIIDDEVHCIESLVIYLHNLFPEMHIVYKSNKVQEAVERIPKLHLDLVFLDVEMPGLNGFQLLEQLSERNFDVIFTTAYSQYAIQAFKIQAANYLLKPIDEQELKEAVEEWKDFHTNKAPDQKVTQLLKQLKKQGSLHSKISVPITNGYEFIEVNDIMYCQSHNNYTSFYLTNEKELLVSKTLKEIEQILDKFFFIRVHQSYIINPNYLKRFSRDDGGYLLIQNDKKIPVSPTKRDMIVRIFKG